MLFGSSRKSFQCCFFYSSISSRYTRRAAWDASRARMVRFPHPRSVVIRISYWSSSRDFYVHRLYFHEHAATMCVRPLVPISKQSSSLFTINRHPAYRRQLYSRTLAFAIRTIPSSSRKHNLDLYPSCSSSPSSVFLCILAQPNIYCTERPSSSLTFVSAS
jgi:hypothetical protein